MIYLDANATTSCSEAVTAEIARALVAAPANPSSIHAAGSEARFALERARDNICTLIAGATPEGVVFNSGGTEGNNAILKGIVGAAIVTSNVEHPSIAYPAHASGRHIKIPVNKNGLVEPLQVAEAIPHDGPVIVSIQWANSETGIIQPIEAIVSEVRSRRSDVFVHVDAAQAVGRVRADMDSVDALTCSGHKLHGPAGTGVIVFRDPDEERIAPFLLGGGQERRRRSGTENVPGAIGLGLAFQERAASFERDVSAMRAMRDAFEDHILRKFKGVRINGADTLRVANTSNIMFPSIEAAALVARLDQEGIACSVGSACSSGRPEPSHVLLAMGLTEKEAYQSARFSFSVMNTMDEALRAADVVVRTASALN
ncbi:cysteine desulfurase family protein [Bosea sp. WAO]|uniref:cysteine desulfurase family protein n=1 Tax=Bosea sp. WAO TaxID=406341 RepID=UPI0012EEC37F|nr:cysteine desulfurase family protein [Bosea sp. WAO]